MAEAGYLTAKEAAATLGISVATLYAYVSRGLIQSEAGTGKSRAKRYRRQDVLALKERKEARRNPAKAAEKALNWGTPILTSAITLIQDGRLFYRGHDVLTLAANHTLADIANLIWRDTLTQGAVFKSTLNPDSLPPYEPLVNLSPITRFQALLPLAAAADLQAYDLSQTAVCATAERILGLLAGVVAGQPLTGDIAQGLQNVWQAQDQVLADLLQAAMIYCADHELNVSAFTARTVASAQATPYAVVNAGLSALQGRLHGGASEQVAALFREVGTPDQARAVIVSRLRRGDGLPGFGHPLYPGGDPRGAALLTQVRTVYPQSAGVQLANEVARAVALATGAQPNIDFALVTLAWAAQLPAGAPLALFALGRTVGWMGHALEEYGREQLIRPRARYNGVAPLIAAGS